MKRKFDRIGRAISVIEGLGNVRLVDVCKHMQRIHIRKLYVQNVVCLEQPKIIGNWWKEESKHKHTIGTKRERVLGITDLL